MSRLGSQCRSVRRKTDDLKCGGLGVGSRRWKWGRSMPERTGWIFLAGMTVTSVELFSFILSSIDTTVSSLTQIFGGRGRIR